MKRYLPFIIIAAVGWLAVAGGAILFRVKRSELGSVAKASSSAGEPGAKPPHIRGDAKAAVTIEEFGDFQCPPCETLARWLPAVERDYGSRLCLVFRNFPLQMHNHALAAACAAEAAGLQGKFWEMHEVLYRNQATWAAAADVGPLFEGFAGQIGIEIAKFKLDSVSEPVKTRIMADQARGASLGVASTPTLFLNSRAVPPKSINEKMLRVAIEDTLSGKDPFPIPSPSPGAGKDRTQ